MDYLVVQSACLSICSRVKIIIFDFQKSGKMGKDKKENKVMDDSQNNEAGAEEMSYEDRLKFVSIISTPMASKKLTKKVRAK